MTACIVQQVLLNQCLLLPLFRQCSWTSIFAIHKSRIHKFVASDIKSTIWCFLDERILRKFVLTNYIKENAIIVKFCLPMTKQSWTCWQLETVDQYKAVLIMDTHSHLQPCLPIVRLVVFLSTIYMFVYVHRHDGLILN